MQACTVSLKKSDYNSSINNEVMTMKRIIIAAIAALALCSCAQKVEETTLRLTHYNVGAFSKYTDNSIKMIADMMNEIGADVVSCNEVDSCTTRTGKVDQMAELAKCLGTEDCTWEQYYTAAMPYKEGAYGVGLCYKKDLKAVKKDGVKLPQLTGKEPRALCVVELEKLIIASCHLDYKTVDSQLGQIAVINEYMDANYKDTEKPIIIFGDFNCLPDSEAIAEMKKTWELISSLDYTFPSDVPDRCIDFIFMRSQGKDVKVSNPVVATEFETGDVAIASDHLPLYVDVTF